MATTTVRKAQQLLPELIKDVASSHEPVLITASHGNAILLSEEDWRAIQETLYLLSIPGLRESIREGLSTPLSECSPEPGW